MYHRNDILASIMKCIQVDKNQIFIMGVTPILICNLGLNIFNSSYYQIDVILPSSWRGKNWESDFEIILTWIQTICKMPINQSCQKCPTVSFVNAYCIIFKVFSNVKGNCNCEWHGLMLEVTPLIICHYHIP